MIHGDKTAIPSQRIHQLFERQADRSPDAPALRWDGRDIDYASLERRANRLAAHLVDIGVTPGDVVAICLPPSPDLIVAVLAVLKAGAAYVPLEPGGPRHRTALIMATAQPRAVLALESSGPELAAGAAPLVRLDRDAGVIDKRGAGRLELPGSGRDLAYVIYTSGSTGVPKGVEVEHRSVVNYVAWASAAYELHRGCGCPMYSPLSFDLTVTSVFCPLLSGRPVHILPDRTGVDALKDATLFGSYSMVKLTPAHLQVLDYVLTVPQARGLAPRLVVGGEQLYAEMLRLWRQHSPQTLIVNEYGPTEATVGCCVWEQTAGALLDGPVPIGRPIANTSLYVVDRDDISATCSPGETGELLVGGLGVARGYRGDPELTARKFIDNPVDDRWSRLYRTGDLVYLRPDGALEYRGRVDDQIKIRGYRVEPGEIEAALLLHPAVRAAAVMPVITHGVVTLAAYLTGWGPGRDGDRPQSPLVDRAGLSDFLRSRVPAHMIPDAVRWLDDLPLTDNGKVDRRALADVGHRPR